MTDPDVDPSAYGALRRVVERDDVRLVLTLGGGGLPGIAGNLALVRLLERLELRGRVTEVWGTSAGAIVAAGWASGTPALEILDLVRSLQRGRALDFCWKRIVAAVLLRPFGRPAPEGLVLGQRFWETIAAGLRVSRIEECEIPFRCIAVRADGKLQRKVFRRGPLLDSVFASMTLPGVVLPRPFADETGEVVTYYDGGLIEKTPLLSPVSEHLRRGDGKRLLLLGTHYDDQHVPTGRRSFMMRFLEAIQSLENLAWDYQLAEVRKRDDVQLMLLNPRYEGHETFDFRGLDRNFEAVFATFADRLKDATLAYTLGSS